MCLTGITGPWSCTTPITDDSLLRQPQLCPGGVGASPGILITPASRPTLIHARPQGSSAPAGATDLLP